MRISDQAVSDWADFALAMTATVTAQKDFPGRQVVYAWSSQDGQRFYTTNPQANPKGVLAGTWTVQEQVPAVISDPQ
jgi:hypothetical protein